MTSSHQSAIANFFHRPSFLQEVVPNASDFEFDESDLYFESSKPRKASKVGQRTKMKGSAKVAAAAEESSRSVPVRIPEWSSRMQAESEGSDGDQEDGERRVPPHEYLARKRGASLSVHEGAGRTLKGRDMSRVRNAVWKRIGFED
ncbi:unnamed protein product [Rhodiola kirilowii]